MLFKPELRKSLDGFVAISQQLSRRLKGLKNTSNTTPTMIGSGVIAAGGNVATAGHPAARSALSAAGCCEFRHGEAVDEPGLRQPDDRLQQGG
jgi:hypothetical protein